MNRGSRGATLLFVSFMLIIVLVGGLAAVAVTSGELAGSRGHRSRAATEACANAAIERIRSLLSNTINGGTIAQADTVGTVTVGGTTLTYRAGHFGAPATNPLIE